MKSRLFSEAHHEDKTVYVVPAFEARETVASPRTKTELLKLVDGGDIRPFYIELCWKCQVMLILSKRCVYKQCNYHLFPTYSSSLSFKRHVKETEMPKVVFSNLRSL